MLAPQTFARQVRVGHLPGPIAASYRRVFTAPESTVERLVEVLRAAETTARFLGSVAHVLVKGNHPPDRDADYPSLRLGSDPLGGWVEFFQLNVEHLREQLNGLGIHPRDALTRALLPLVFAPDRSTEARPLQGLRNLAEIRRRLFTPDARIDLLPTVQEAEELLHGLVDRIAFFEEYGFFTYKLDRITPQSPGPPIYTYQAVSLRGDFAQMSRVQRSPDHAAPENALVLTYQGSPVLSLWPFWLYLFADDVRVATGDGVRPLPGLHGLAGVERDDEGAIAFVYQHATYPDRRFVATGAREGEPSFLRHLQRDLTQLIPADEAPNAAPVEA